MSTKFSDLNYVPELFVPYVFEQVMERSAFFQSGAIVPAGLGITAGGTSVNVPSFNGMTEDSIPLIDTANLSITNLDTTNQIAPILTRGRAWGSTDLARWQSGRGDLMDIMAGELASYWQREIDKIMVGQAVASAEAVDNSEDDVILDVSGAAGAAGLLSAAAINDARGLGGEYMDDYNLLIVDSATKTRLKNLNLVDAGIPIAENTVADFFMGQRIVVSDRMPVDTGVHTLLHVRPGAFIYDEGGIDPSRQVEFGREELVGAGTDFVVARKRMVVHPVAASYAGTIPAAGAGPDNAALSTAGNWELGLASKLHYGVRALKFRLA